MHDRPLAPQPKAGSPDARERHAGSAPWGSARCCATRKSGCAAAASAPRSWRRWQTARAAESAAAAPTPGSAATRCCLHCRAAAAAAAPLRGRRCRRPQRRGIGVAAYAHSGVRRAAAAAAPHHASSRLRPKQQRHDLVENAHAATASHTHAAPPCGQKHLAWKAPARLPDLFTAMSHAQSCMLSPPRSIFGQIGACMTQAVPGEVPTPAYPSFVNQALWRSACGVVPGVVCTHCAPMYDARAAAATPQLPQQSDATR